MLGLSRRERTLCAVLLAVITVTAATGAWLTWRALKDQQVQLQGQATARSDVADEHSLEGDLATRDGSTVSKPSTPGRAAPVERSTDSRRSTPSIRTGSSTTIDGTVVAGVAVLVVLTVAAGAARLLVTRFRRSVEEAGVCTEVESSPFRERREDDADPEIAAEDVDALVDDAADRQEPQVVDDVRVPSTGGSEAQALLLTGLPGEQDPPERSALLQEETAPALAQSLLLDEPVVPLQRSSTWEAERDEPAPREPGRDLVSSFEQDSSSFEAADSTGPSERIFDRRISRRVPYVQSAWLWWGDANGPVTVQDLSATGLRLILVAASRPTPGQSVRIFFPVSGTTVKAQARVQWRKAAGDGLEVGLEFLDLPADDEELIKAVLLTAQ